MANVQASDTGALDPRSPRGQSQAILAACAALKGIPAPLLPVLHEVQKTIGYVPRESVPLIANELNLSIAEVHGVITFYHYFRQDPGGRHIVHLCRAEACQAVGALAVEAHAKRTLGVDFHGTTDDGAVRLEPVYCLGNCALGPAVMIDNQLYGGVSAARFDELIGALRGASPLKS